MSKNYEENHKIIRDTLASYEDQLRFLEGITKDSLEEFKIRRAETRKKLGDILANRRLSEKDRFVRAVKFILSRKRKNGEIRQALIKYHDEEISFIEDLKRHLESPES